MTKDEALKLALEKFEFMNHVDSIFEGEFNFQINAIKEALAQPEHDKTDVRCECCGYMTYHREHLGCIRAAKLKEPEQEPLTDEDRELLERALRFYEGCPDGQYDELMVELIRDRLAQPAVTESHKQEPVAWLNEEKKIIYWHNTHETDDYHGFKRTTPLYTTPPQRKPLTDEEIMNIAKVSCIGISPQEDTLNFAKVIEAVHGIKGEV